MLRPVTEVAHMDTQLSPAGRHDDPFFLRSRRHDVGFIRDLVKVGSVGFVEMAVEHVGLFFVAKKAGAQRFIVDACASNRHFVRPPDGPLTGEKNFAMSNFREHLRTLIIWFVGSDDIKNAFHQMDIPGKLQTFFELPSVVASEVCYTGNTVNQKRLAPDSLKNPVPTTLPMGFSWALFFCPDVTDHWTLSGSADYPLFVFVVTTPNQR